MKRKLLAAAVSVLLSGPAHAEDSYLYSISQAFTQAAGTVSGWFRAANITPTTWVIRDFDITASAGTANMTTTNLFLDPSRNFESTSTMAVAAQTFNPSLYTGPTTSGAPGSTWASSSKTEFSAGTYVYSGAHGEQDRTSGLNVSFSTGEGTPQKLGDQKLSMSLGVGGRTSDLQMVNFATPRADGTTGTLIGTIMNWGRGLGIGAQATLMQLCRG